MKKNHFFLSFLALMCLAAVMLSSCSNEETKQAVVVDPYNGHEYVDLGLSVKWATCNISAEKPENYGAYFAWGETTPKDNFSWDNYKFTTDGGNTLTKYNGSGIAGCIITGKGKYADRSMFLPATGIFSGSSHLSATQQGYYWSSTLHNASDSKYLGAVVGGSMSPYGYNNRHFGFPVRAVFTFSE